MKRIFPAVATPLFGALILFSACDKEDDTQDMDLLPQYRVHILSPDASDKHVGDTLQIEIEIEEATGMTIHHANVRIYNPQDGTEIFNQPQQAHVHATSGYYRLTDEVVLDVAPHTDWLLVARAWGHEAGVAEVADTLAFHVHP